VRLWLCGVRISGVSRNLRVRLPDWDYKRDDFRIFSGLVEVDSRLPIPHVQSSPTEGYVSLCPRPKNYLRGGYLLQESGPKQALIPRVAERLSFNIPARYAIATAESVPRNVSRPALLTGRYKRLHSGYDVLWLPRPSAHTVGRGECACVSLPCRDLESPPPIASHPTMEADYASCID